MQIQHEEAIKKMTSQLEQLETQKREGLEILRKELSTEKEQAINDQQRLATEIQNKMTTELEELKSEQASKVDVLQGLIEASESDLEQAREKAEMDKLELNNKIGQMNQEIEELQRQVKDWKQVSLEKTENLQ